MPILGIDMYKGCISTASPYTALGPDVDTLLISRHSPDLGHVVEKRSEATTHILVLITRHLQLGQESILFVDKLQKRQGVATPNFNPAEPATENRIP